DIHPLSPRDGGNALVEASSGDSPQWAADTPCEGVCLRERQAFSYDGIRALSPLAANRPVAAPKSVNSLAYQPRILGCRISRKASPSRLTASTAREMARPGNTTSHQRGL